MSYVHELPATGGDHITALQMILYMCEYSAKTLVY